MGFNCAEARFAQRILHVRVEAGAHAVILFMNVIVICSDTFRYDHLGFLGRQQILTPNLDRLAREGASFSDFRLCSFPTLVNRIEVFTGRHTFPLFNWGPLPFQFPVLGEVFQHHGFVTALIADNPHLMKEKFGFGRGFDFVKNVPGQMHTSFRPDSDPMIDLSCPAEKLDLRPDRLDRYRRNAYWYRQQGTNTTELVFGEAMRWLENSPDRFFLWIDSFDPHEPWDAPRQHLDHYPWNPQGDAVIWPRSGKASFYSDADLANIRSLYKSEVTQSDYWIGKLLESLQVRKLLDQTIIIFCSDHGFHLGEHDLIGKLFPPVLRDRNKIGEALAHIPLLIRHPQGIAAGATIPGLCEPPDLFPTVLELAGVPPVPWAQGHSLVSRLSGQSSGQPFVVSGYYPHRGSVNHLTVWTDDWCFILSPSDRIAGSELYHRSTDPGLTRNVIANHRSVAEQHFEMLRSWLEQLDVPAVRRQQLLHAGPFNWVDRMWERFWRLRCRWSYQTKYRNYARTTNQRTTR